MTTFDKVLPVIEQVMEGHRSQLSQIDAIYINRDLNGRIRLIVSDDLRNPVYSACRDALDSIVRELHSRLPAQIHAPGQAVLYEKQLDRVRSGANVSPLQGFESVWVLDRLATQTAWSDIRPEARGAKRVVFFSIKGGVGRSTALAASAWALAQAGKKVLVVDLDLESPGLSSSLLEEDRRPAYGITDWLVEDLLDNGEAVLDDLIAASPLSHDGEIYVAPAHGRDPGDYISKLGRVWMSKRGPDGELEAWSERLGRLLNQLEARLQPDVILIDSRAGIDEVAASSIAQLGAHLILLFAIDGSQTWTGYRVLFRHWNQSGRSREIRERLQFVGAMVPEGEERESYFNGLQEQAWATFSELYDEIPPGLSAVDLFNYDVYDDAGPHYPWPIRWHRSFSAVRSLGARLAVVDPHAIQSIFGELSDRLVELSGQCGEQLE